MSTTSTSKPENTLPETDDMPRARTLFGMTYQERILVKQILGLKANGELGWHMIGLDPWIEGNPLTYAYLTALSERGVLYRWRKGNDGTYGWHEINRPRKPRARAAGKSHGAARAARKAAAGKGS